MECSTLIHNIRVVEIMDHRARLKALSYELLLVKSLLQWWMMAYLLFFLYNCITYDLIYNLPDFILNFSYWIPFAVCFVFGVGKHKREASEMTVQTNFIKYFCLLGLFFPQSKRTKRNSTEYRPKYGNVKY